MVAAFEDFEAVFSRLGGANRLEELRGGECAEDFANGLTADRAFGEGWSGDRAIQFKRAATEFAGAVAQFVTVDRHGANVGLQGLSGVLVRFGGGVPGTGGLKAPGGIWNPSAGAPGRSMSHAHSYRPSRLIS